MHTVELLEHALDAAVQLGYSVRQEPMAGGGGGCELNGRKLFFLDLDLEPAEQLEQLVETLRRESEADLPAMPDRLQEMLASRKCA